MALIVSIPPDEAGDPALRTLRRVLERAQALTHIVYLSTIGVYGDFKGAWIDEATPPNGASERAARRLKAEEAGSLSAGSAASLSRSCALPAFTALAAIR